MPTDPLRSEPAALPPAWGKAYRSPGLTVHYDARRCIHFAECVRGAPDVFVPGERPWIRPALATDPAALAEVVRRCPTGALHFSAGEVGEAVPPETPERPTEIVPLPDGPLTVRGDLRIRTPEGELEETRAALCRCGASGHKPFCDGTHAKIGWKSD